MTPELDALDDLLDRIGGSDFSTYADSASVRHVHRILARFEAVVTEATAAFHDRRRTLREPSDVDDEMGGNS